MRAFFQSLGTIPVRILWLQIFAICLPIKGDDSLRILNDMLSLPVALLLSRLDIHLPTKCSVMKGILNIFSQGSLSFMNSFRGSISGEWFLLLEWLKYFSAILVKCLLKILAMSASRVYTLLSCIIDVIFTAFWVWLSFLNTLANILG